MNDTPAPLPKSRSQRKKAAELAREKKKRLFIAALVMFPIFFSLGLAVGYFSNASQRREMKEVAQTAVIAPQPAPDDFVPDLGHLVMLSPGQLEGIDIAAMDLACAEGLPGNETLNVRETLRTLDAWAEHVREETDRNLHRYWEHPEDFFHSESYWRAAMMITILQQDYGVHYNLERMQDMSMTHGEDVFMSGLLGPLREGTCSSMPVLYIAVGRRLGYPLYLVRAKGHYFVRWESKDGKVRFNMEATAKGLTCSPDDFYKGWPYAINADELKSGLYLRPMTGSEEMAEFLVMRGWVLDALKRMPEAEMAYAEAHALMPNNYIDRTWLALARGKEDMMAKGLLDPNDPQNPFRDKVPPPYTTIEPVDDAQKYSIHDETGP